MKNNNRSNTNGNKNSQDQGALYGILATVERMIKGNTVALVHCTKSNKYLEVPATLKRVEAVMGRNNKVQFGYDEVGGSFFSPDLRVRILARDSEPVKLMCWTTQESWDACGRRHNGTFRVSIDIGGNKLKEIASGNVLDIEEAVRKDRSLADHLIWEELIDGEFRKIEGKKVPVLCLSKSGTSSRLSNPRFQIVPKPHADSAAA